MGRRNGDARAIVQEAECRLAPLSVDRNLAWWESQVAATSENEERRTRAEIAWSNDLADGELFTAVESARDGGVSDGAGRELELLRNLMLPHQVPAELRERIVELESSVDVRFSRHRGLVRGVEVDDTEIKRILRQSDDVPERREAWEGSKTVGAEVADDVRELARLRNEAARELGYRDWFALSLAADELDESKLIETLVAAERVTAEPFARWKTSLDERLAGRFGCPVSELRPWHYADPFFQEPPPDGAVDLDPLFAGRDVVGLARRTFEGIGLPVEGILGGSDLYPRDGKCQHAFCIDVDRGGDVRVLANVVSTQESQDTMLHELGHGVYDLGFRDGLPWLLRSTHLVATEASAILFGALAGRREWLEAVLGLGADEGAELESRLRAARAVELLVFTRWVLVMNAFERALYADPDGDLDSLWWRLVSRYQEVTPPDGWHAPDWAAKIHIAVAPVYYHTYLYGAIVASQIAAGLESSVGGIVDRPEAGTELREKLFGPGQSMRWDRLVERATGAPFSVDALAHEVAAAGA
ncbi:MAG TPA: M2 family metallopeptidase [Gaiellaceae bacterium]|nr:M2 family metallopeptidase [Gaiellaceae bacterium]